LQKTFVSLGRHFDGSKVNGGAMNRMLKPPHNPIGIFQQHGIPFSFM